MNLFNKKKKNKLIFEFEEDANGILVTTKVEGKLTYDDVVCVKNIIDKRLKECQKQKKVSLKNK